MGTMNQATADGPHERSNVVTKERWIMQKRRVIRLQGKAMSELRRKVFARDGYRCVDCMSIYHLELSHNVPRSLGGEDTEENTACRCRECHRERDLHGCPGHF